MTDYSNKSAKSISNLLSSFYPTTDNPLVHAKIDAIELVDVSCPF